MLLIISISGYVIIGALVAASLLTDRQTNTSKLDAVLSTIAGLVWPLAIGAAAGFALFENLHNRYLEKRRTRNEQILRFTSKLVRMGLISSNAHYAVIREMNK